LTGIRRKADEGTVTEPRALSEATPESRYCSNGHDDQKAINPRRVGGLARDEPSSLREKP